MFLQTTAYCKCVLVFRLGVAAATVSCSVTLSIRLRPSRSACTAAARVGDKAVILFSLGGWRKGRRRREGRRRRFRRRAGLEEMRSSLTVARGGPGGRRRGSAWCGWVKENGSPWWSVSMRDKRGNHHLYFKIYVVFSLLCAQLRGRKLPTRNLKRAELCYRPVNFDILNTKTKTNSIIHWFPWSQGWTFPQPFKKCLKF